MVAYTNYLRGRRKEYRFIHEAKEKGFIALRSSGSHSPIDVVIIDEKEKKIALVQCKPDNFPKNKKKLLEEAYVGLNGDYKVNFYVA